MSIYFQKTFQRAFGTFPLRKDELYSAMKAALEVGYRAFDTAQMYNNDAEVGEVLAKSGIPRTELCITTKVDPANYAHETFLPSVETSLKKLQLDYVDVLLLHWPPIGEDIGPSLRLLERAYKQGLAKHVGVSNYTVQMMRDITKYTDVPIVINQVEFHPLLNQDKLLAASVETGIPLASYCSVARGAVFKDPEFAEIGKAYDKSAVQIVLRWILQKGVVLTTMSTKKANMEKNFDVMDFALSSIDMARIDKKTAAQQRLITLDLAPWAPKWD